MEIVQNTSKKYLFFGIMTCQLNNYTYMYALCPLGFENGTGQTTA